MIIGMGLYSKNRERTDTMQEKNGKLRLSLFLTFLKIGAFTFGGGYAMIPLIQQEAAEKKKWISEEDIMDIVAIAESTPGPLAVNTATFVGYKTAGNTGAALATLGVVLPSFLIILAISFVLRQFERLQIVKAAFFGIRAGVLALIIRAMLSMYRQCPKDAVSYGIMAFAFVGSALMGWNVLLIILLSAAAGLTAFHIKGRGRQ